jgi:hypothetical protein
MCRRPCRRAWRRSREEEVEWQSVDQKAVSHRAGVVRRCGGCADGSIEDELDIAGRVVGECLLAEIHRDALHRRRQPVDVNIDDSNTGL